MLYSLVSGSDIQTECRHIPDHATLMPENIHLENLNGEGRLELHKHLRKYAVRIGSCPVRALVLARLNIRDLLQDIRIAANSKMCILLHRPTNAQHIYKQRFIYRKYCYMFRRICTIFREYLAFYFAEVIEVIKCYKLNKISELKCSRDNYS